MSRFACEVCGKHPRDGHLILRVSAKGEPFRGRCEDHCPEDDDARE